MRIAVLVAVLVFLSFTQHAVGDLPPPDWQVTGFGQGGTLINDATVEYDNGTWDIETGRSRSVIVCKSLSGDVSLVLKLTDATGQQNADMGIMMWSSLATTAGKAGLILDPQGQKISFTWDETTDRPQFFANYVQCEGIGFPVWLKLTRSGSYFMAFYSKDGEEWRPVGIPIKTFWAGKRPEIYAGIYADGVCEERVTDLQAVQAPAMTLPEQLPGEWALNIHGEPEFAGQATYADGKWTLIGANSSGRDGFHNVTVLKPVSSKVEITAKIQTSGLDDPRVGGGLILSAHGIDAGIQAFPAGGILTFFTRQNNDGRILQKSEIPIPSAMVGQAEAYLRLALADGRVAAFYATDTNDWTQVGGVFRVDEMAADVAGGMELLSISGSHSAPTAGFEDFQDTSIVALPIAIPAWQVQEGNFHAGYYYWPAYGQQPSDAEFFSTWNDFNKRGIEITGASQTPTPTYVPPPRAQPASQPLPKGIQIGSIIVVVGIIVLIFAIIFCITPFNRLVYLRNRMLKGWAQIDVQLKRRHDLILNLIEVVKGYAKHESGTFEKVAKARSDAMNATTMEERGKAESALNTNLRTLNAVAQSYPELKANQNFLSLQNNLTNTEDKLAAARIAYNEEVLTYNTSVQSFPTNLIAFIFRFKAGDFFNLKEAEQREPPKAGM